MTFTDRDRHGTNLLVCVCYESKRSDRGHSKTTQIMGDRARREIILVWKRQHVRGSKYRRPSYIEMSMGAKYNAAWIHEPQVGITKPDRLDRAIKLGRLSSNDPSKDIS